MSIQDLIERIESEDQKMKDFNEMVALEYKKAGLSEEEADQIWKELLEKYGRKALVARVIYNDLVKELNELVGKAFKQFEVLPESMGDFLHRSFEATLITRWPIVKKTNVEDQKNDKV